MEYVGADKVTRLSAHVIMVDYTLRAGEWAGVFLSADHHWDNPKCQQDLLKRDLKEATKRNADCFIFGDLFCAMQGRFDRRSSKSDIRPEHNNGDYLGSLVRTGADWYAPFAKQIRMVSRGNHESAIKNKLEFDLMSHFVERLNILNGSRIEIGKYQGWVFFRFKNESGKTMAVKKLAYHHGYGGDAPVTKGTIQTNRQAVYLPDADFVVSGHTHNKWQFPINRYRISKMGRAYIDEQMHIKLPTYKEEFLQGEGWHVERGAPPKPLGGAFLEFAAVYDGGSGINANIKARIDWTWSGHNIPS